MNAKFRLRISEDDTDVAYLYFPAHPGEGAFSAAVKQIRLIEQIPNLREDIYLDIDAAGNIVGIEILL